MSNPQEATFTLKCEIKEIQSSQETGNFIILIPDKSSSEFAHFMSVHNPYKNEVHECEYIAIAAHPISGPLRMKLNGGESYFSDLHFFLMTVEVEEICKKVLETSTQNVEIKILPISEEENFDI